MSTRGPIVGIGELLWDMLPTGPQPGGAPFNFAFHCHQLGNHAAIVSRVGDDELGHRLLAEVRARGLTDEFIQIDRVHPTGTVQVNVDADGQPSYTIVENVAYDYLEWTPALHYLAGATSAACFGTLGQRHEPSRGTIQHLLRRLRQRKEGYTDRRRGPIAVFDINLRQRFYSWEIIESSLRLCDWFKLNRDELKVLADHFRIAEAAKQYWSEIPRESAILQLLAWHCNVPLIWLTRGEDGSLIGENGPLVGGPLCEILSPGFSIQVVDAVGAGDAFTAGLLTQVIEGKQFGPAAAFANALAALVASRPGGTPRIDRADVEALAREAASS